VIVDVVDCFQLADHFCNAVGVLQQSAPPGQFVGFEKTASKPPAVTNEGDLINIQLAVYRLYYCWYFISYI